MYTYATQEATQNSKHGIFRWVQLLDHFAREIPWNHLCSKYEHILL